MIDIDFTLTEEYITLSNLLKVTNISQSGGHSKILIVEGHCHLNGEKCTMRGKKLHAGDVVKVYLDDTYKIKILG